MKNHSSVSAALRYGLSALALMLPVLASATCTRRASDNTPSPPVPSPWRGRIIPRNSGTVDTVLATSTHSGGGLFASLCAVDAPADWAGAYRLPAGWSYDAVKNRLNTNLRGVALQVRANSATLTGGVDRALQYTHRKTMRASDGRPVPGRPNLVQIFDDSNYTLELVWSQPTIEFGQITDGTFAYFYSDNDTAAPYLEMSTQGLVLLAPSCDINSRDLNQTIALGRHTASDLAAGPSAWKEFHFTSENCDATRFTNARFTFSAPAVAGTGLFEVRGGATGIGLHLQAMPASGAVEVRPNTVVPVLPLNSGRTYQFRARLQALAGQVPGPGAINTPVRVTVDFM